MSDFFSTDGGQFAGLAKQFLEGALTLNEAQREKGRILFRPTLMLAGQGLELMLKACICLNGERPPTKGRSGHDILGLWPSDLCAPVRWHVYESALRTVAFERIDGGYPDLPQDGEIVPLIERYVVDLSKLHGGGGYPLRYPADAEQTAPRTPFLVKSLWGAADDLVKRPNDFELTRFRDLVRMHGSAGTRLQ